MKNQQTKIREAHEAVSSVREEIVSAEIEANLARSAQHLPGLLRVAVGARGARTRLISPQAASWLLVPLISRGGGVTDKSQALPQVHAFKGFPHEPDATHS